MQEILTQVQQNQQNQIDFQLKYKIKEKGQNWKTKNLGFLTGKYSDYNNDSTCYLNGGEYVRIYKDKYTQKLLVQRFHVYPEKNGTIMMTERQVLDLGYSDQIRVYKVVKVAMNYVGSFQLASFIDVSQRKDGQKRFYFTFDYNTKKWKGIWGQPKKNWKLNIGYKGQLLLSSQWKTHQKKKQQRNKLISFRQLQMI